MKTCICCKIVKPKNSFHKDSSRSDGYCNKCKECVKVYQAGRYKKISKEVALYNNNYYSKNRSYLLNKANERATNNKDYIKQYHEKYYSIETNRIKRNIWFKNKMKNPIFRLKQSIRRRLRTYFKKHKQFKTTYNIDWDLLKSFPPRPSSKHDLDHIIPLSAFDLSNSKHIKLAHLPENLRWLSYLENRIKSDKIPWDIINCSLKLKMIANEIKI